MFTNRVRRLDGTKIKDARSRNIRDMESYNTKVELCIWEF